MKVYEKYRVYSELNDELKGGPRPKQHTNKAIYARREDEKRQSLTSLV